VGDPEEAMKTLATLLLASLLCACAAHNSHRIPIDLNADLAPLIDEAWTRMEEAAGESVAIGGVPVQVEVEPVDVHWLPFSPEIPPGASVIPQAELRTYIEDALRAQAPPASASTTRRVRVQLAVDLQEPDALEIQVECALLGSGAHSHVLARGLSTRVHFERLYCHGCRDPWYGDGSRLEDGEHVHGELDGDGGGFLFYWPSSSPGYIKN
jgi:hypothetical protein